MKTQKRIIGDLGEGVTCNFLSKKGFKIIERNYQKPWGEIDIIAQKSNLIHFIEVKTVSRENFSDTKDVKRETIYDEYRAEDNIHPWKLKRLSRVIQTYLLNREEVKGEGWQFDVAVVYLDVKNRLAKVKYMENIIIS